MLLSELPAEIIYLIATHLPTVSGLAYLARTCRRLHRVITSEDWRILRAFVETRFNSIPTPGFWKDAAQALTSRSRALDRHAVIGRVMVRPAQPVPVGGSIQATRGDNPTHGYRPAIDSYEVWNGSSWHDRHEVLAWGAAHELILQVRRTGSRQTHRSFVFNDLEHISSHDDIRGLHLLRPEHRAKKSDQEHLIIGRMRGGLLHLGINPETQSYEYTQKFQTFGRPIERTEMGDGPEPILAAHLNNGTIAFYSTTTDETEVEAFAQLQLDTGSSARNSSSSFISPNRFAAGTGRSEDAITIFTISRERISVDRSIGSDLFVPSPLNGHNKRPIVTAIAPLDCQTTRASVGSVFLAAWGDGIVRLHDIRSDKPCEQRYMDMADLNPVYCIHPFSHDRFVLGAGGDAVVKIFDLRRPLTYDYLNARPRLLSKGMSTEKPAETVQPTHPSKELSLFLSFNDISSRNSRNRSRFPRRYRGPIYTMSSPSLLSPTVYTGVAGGIVRLDFASTDDLTGSEQSWYRDRIDLQMNQKTKVEGSGTSSVLDLSGYERPSVGNTTTCSKLRNQQPLEAIDNASLFNERETGWDRRWRPLDEPGAWRRRD
ncbi:hypothetical protein BJY01DRAFT_216364 [Aspergillus pseudoustus]|uniref:F-box domain-containing protein n=1 Tax=Aspergillus pseudoustus TaxID=1810923 RepID=A0ABR4JRV9_9EURO